ncbi:MAG: DoxX family protein [Magnetovibrionaceae bacterium]
MITSTRLFFWLLALVFFASGLAKLLAFPFEVEAFERWGYPIWFMYAAGGIEVAGAVALFIERLRAAAALGLAAFMIGAVVTHFRFAEWGMMMLALVILLSALALGLRHRAEAFALARRFGLPV